MLTTFNDIMLNFMDVILGWMLYFPQDVSLLVVGIGTSAILTFARPFMTNQDLLGRCKEDKKRLKELIREAKKRRDKDAVKRHRATIAAIGMKNFRAEGKPLLLAIVPIALLAVWAWGRLGYVPPQGGEEVIVNVQFRDLSIGKIAHIVPVDGLEARATDDGTWVRRVVPDPATEGLDEKKGLALWTVVPDGRDEPYVLEIRHEGKTYRKEMLVDGLRYAPPVKRYGKQAIEAVQLVHEEFRPFGVIPGIPGVLAPWLVGYLLITVPFVFLLRWLCRIH